MFTYQYITGARREEEVIFVFAFANTRGREGGGRK